MVQEDLSMKCLPIDGVENAGQMQKKIKNAEKKSGRSAPEAPGHVGHVLGVEPMILGIITHRPRGGLMQRRPTSVGPKWLFFVK
jgi:hypothetical protein